MSDADTIANAGELWELVRLVQETITPRGEPIDADGRTRTCPHLRLRRLRELADRIAPERL